MTTADTIFLNLRHSLSRIPKHDLASVARISTSAASKAKLGFVPKSRTFFDILEALGREAALKILQPLIGEATVAHQLAKLNEVERLLGKIHEATVSGLSEEQRLALDGVLFGKDRGMGDGSRMEGGGAGEADACALSVQRINPCELSPFLKDRFDAWRASRSAGCGELIDLAKTMADRRMGVSERKEGVTRFSHINPAYRLYKDPRAMVGMPITEGPDKAYAVACAKDIDQVLDSGYPMLARVSAEVEMEPGVRVKMRYQRLWLPYGSAILGGTEMIAA